MYLVKAGNETHNACLGDGMGLKRVPKVGKELPKDWSSRASKFNFTCLQVCLQPPPPFKCLQQSLPTTKAQPPCNPHEYNMLIIDLTLFFHANQSPLPTALCLISSSHHHFDSTFTYFCKFSWLTNTTFFSFLHTI